MWFNLAQHILGISAPRRLNETITTFLAGYDNLASRKTYAQVLRPFAAVIGHERRLNEVTPEDIDVWRQRLPMEALATATIAKRVKAVKTFWNWCVKREYIPRSPARFLVVRRPQTLLVSKAIPSDVLTAMFTLAQGKRCEFSAVRDTAILTLLITYGARVGEVAHLRLSDIYPKQRQILFRGKGGKKRILPLPKQIIPILAGWLDLRDALYPEPVHDFLFVNNRIHSATRHGPLASGSIAIMVRRLSLQVGKMPYGPHAIRHWRGQTLADQRVAPTIVQAILGHSDVRITLTHYYNQDLCRVARVLETYSLGVNTEAQQ